MAKTTRKRGRPPAGPADAKVSEYPRLMLRLSPSVLADLKAWSAIRGRPVWRLIEDAVTQALKNEPTEVRELVRKVAQRRQSEPRGE